VRAADIVVTDMDGVAIVPREHAEEVLKKPQQLDDTEHSTLPFIETYKSIREAVVRCCSAVAAPEKADSLCRTHVPGPPHPGSSQRILYRSVCPQLRVRRASTGPAARSRSSLRSFVGGSITRNRKLSTATAG